MTRTIVGGLPVGFRYTPGVGNTAFLEALRDRGILLGSHCGSCGITYLPARIFCERCMSELTPDTECGPGGELMSWTIGHVGIDEDDLNEPIAVGLVRCDGADTVLMHRLLEGGEWRIGARVEVVLRDAGERTASIMDIEGFRLT
jgi:uncharacterized OB-fold protein